MAAESFNGFTTPTPEILTVPPEVESLTERVPDIGPELVGEKTTVALHFDWAGSESPQVLLVIEKPALAVIALTGSAASPVLLSSKSIGAEDAPMRTSPKLAAVGEIDKTVAGLLGCDPGWGNPQPEIIMQITKIVKKAAMQEGMTHFCSVRMQSVVERMKTSHAHIGCKANVVRTEHSSQSAASL